ncbi:MAG TPA: hypothetical protein VNF47_09410 [Streptosporangiaceae bacterium]|nr:hypothetical protein [Streptosporangiaceae bacterium]
MAAGREAAVREAAVREPVRAGIRFRFRADPGLERWVRDLARREAECCAFFRFSVTAVGQEVWWDAWVIDDDAARQVLGEFYRLPDALAGDTGAKPVLRRASGNGAAAGQGRAG